MPEILDFFMWKVNIKQRKTIKNGSKAKLDSLVGYGFGLVFFLYTL